MATVKGCQAHPQGCAATTPAQLQPLSSPQTEPCPRGQGQQGPGPSLGPAFSLSGFAYSGGYFFYGKVLSGVVLHDRCKTKFTILGERIERVPCSVLTPRR